MVVKESQVTEKWRIHAQPGGVGESRENIDLYKCVFDRKFLIEYCIEFVRFQAEDFNVLCLILRDDE